MQLNKLKHFLESRGWIRGTSGKRFTQYSPPPSLQLPTGFSLEIPIQETTGKGMELYFSGVIETIMEVYSSYKEEDLNVLLNTDSTIYCTRIMDEDTKDGTIQLDKFGKVIDLQKKVLKQSVIFLVSNEQIFGHADLESRSFLENSRSLPTSRGSFITKIKLPEAASVDRHIAPESVVKKVFSVLEFVNEEVTHVDIDKIDNKFILDHREYINIELLSSINNLFKSAQLNNVEQSYYNNHEEHSLRSENMISKSNHIYKFIRKTRDLIVNESAVRFTGSIQRLNSVDPIHSDENSIVIVSTDGESSVKTILNKDQYGAAVDAHRRGLLVTVFGKAKQYAKFFLIQNPEEFLVIDTD